MKITSLFSLLVLLLSVAGSTAFAAQTEDDYEKTCRAYAQEDNVPAEELDAYVKDCVEGLIAEKADS